MYDCNNFKNLVILIMDQEIIGNLFIFCLKHCCLLKSIPTYPLKTQVWQKENLPYRKSHGLAGISLVLFISLLSLNLGLDS